MKAGWSAIFGCAPATPISDRGSAGFASSLLTLLIRRRLTLADNVSVKILSFVGKSVGVITT